jgi:hypothetical protein
VTPRGPSTCTRTCTCTRRRRSPRPCTNASGVLSRGRGGN